LHVTFAQSPLDKRTGFFAQNQRLGTALIVLSEVSQVGISFSDEVIPPDTYVSADFTNARLETILLALLRDTDIRYKIISNQVVLYRYQPEEKYTVSGFVVDAENGERLIGANVFTEDNQQGTFTNEYGFFSLTLPKSTVNLLFSYLGYQLESEKVKLTENRKITVGLKPSVTLKEVLVLSSNAPDAVAMEAKLNFSRERLPLERVKILPRLGGEVDVLRATTLLPGVHTGADGVGGIHVRGGNADQNLILLDGVPVYNPLHAIGIFSVFNTNAVKSARLIKGGFPARYGGRLSSVMDLRTREGNSYDYQANVGASLISIDGTVEGPIEKGKSSFILSGRRALTDLFIKPITRFSKNSNGEEGFTSYYFYDLNGKVNFELSPRDRIYFSAYTGGDSFESESKLEQNSE
ncbi:MAG: carboxypeptidase-like regulatory domain-containing protein, partial [Bacteroidota bacterium]